MNLETSTEVWQTDTGPVAFPDLTKRYVSTTIIAGVWAAFPSTPVVCGQDPPLASVSLGFVAANNRQLERADFVVEQLMELPDGGGAEVLHYCKPFSLPALNTLWAIPPPMY